MTEVVWTTFARTELRKAMERIAEDNPYAARRIKARIESAASDLVLFPRRGTRGRAPDTYELVISDLPYTIVYDCNATGDVLVLRLRHHRRRRIQSH